MVSNILYDDGRVLLDEDALTLRRYYFPIGYFLIGTSKRIPSDRFSGSVLGQWGG